MQYLNVLRVKWQIVTWLNNDGCINEIKENGDKIVAQIDNLDRDDKLKGRLRGLSNQLNKFESNFIHYEVIEINWIN